MAHPSTRAKPEQRAQLESEKADLVLVERARRLTREALNDVDAGRVIDHQTVLAWAENHLRSS